MHDPPTLVLGVCGGRIEREGERSRRMGGRGGGIRFDRGGKERETVGGSRRRSHASRNTFLATCHHPFLLFPLLTFVPPDARGTRVL
jgi:hypothetical protein